MLLRKCVNSLTNLTLLLLAGRRFRSVIDNRLLAVEVNYDDLPDIGILLIEHQLDPEYSSRHSSPCLFGDRLDLDIFAAPRLLSRNDLTGIIAG